MQEHLYFTVRTVLDSTLGEHSVHGKGEVAYHCPFCGHRKKKLQVNIFKGKWHCWVCNTKGARLDYLLAKNNASSADIARIRDIYKYNISQGDPTQAHTQVRLPDEFTSVFDIKSTITRSRVFNYLNNRNISESECVKYNIGYAASGPYSGRIIIPSYSSDGNLNYFVSRLVGDGYLKYKMPDVSKSIIAFDSYIDWKSPVVLVEGVFDAIAVKRNAIPILGKYIVQPIIDKLITENVSDVVVMLDSDAIHDSLHHVSKLMSYGITVKHVIPTKKDASVMGYSRVNSLITHTPTSTWETVLYTKLSTI